MIQEFDCQSVVYESPRIFIEVIKYYHQFPLYSPHATPSPQEILPRLAQLPVHGQDLRTHANAAVPVIPDP